MKSLCNVRNIIFTITLIVQPGTTAWALSFNWLTGEAEEETAPSAPAKQVSAEPPAQAHQVVRTNKSAKEPQKSKPEKLKITAPEPVPAAHVERLVPIPKPKPKIKTTKSKRKRRKVFAAYHDPVIGSGLCLPPVSNVTEILTRNGLNNTRGALPAERAALAKGIAQVERLLGHPIPKSWREPYVWINSKGKWKQTGGGIHVRRLLKGKPNERRKGQLTGRMIHEQGHRIGNNGGLYPKYNKAVPKKFRCKITTYCTCESGKNKKGCVPHDHDSRNEEFAEAYEIFVVEPEYLKEVCPRSYDFFANTVFPNSAGKLASCGNRFQFSEGSAVGTQAAQ